MSKSFQMGEKAEFLVKLLDGLKIELQKINQNTQVRKAKILTYNKGYIQYVNKNEFLALQKAQSTSTLNKEEFIYNHGYLVYKAGVNIKAFNYEENQIECGWNKYQQNVYYIILKFNIKHKVIYNPVPEVQKKQKKKTKDNPLKNVTWYFEVQLKSEITKIQTRLIEIEEYNKRLEKLKACEKFANKFEQMEIEIQDSEMLLQELEKNQIEIQFLGYISNKLENNTNRKIITADIAARSLYLYMSNLNEYKLNKMSMIEQMIKALYKDKQRNFNQQVIQIARNKFESNLEAQNFEISDVLFLNALMFNFQFSIELDVKNLLDYQSFFSSLIFKSLENTESTQIIRFHNNDNDDEMKFMNYKNFQTFSKKPENLHDVNKYCVGLFGEENQYLGMFYLELYKQKPKKQYLEKAITLFEKNLKNSHPLLKEACSLSKKEESIQKSTQLLSQHMNITISHQTSSTPQQVNVQQSAQNLKTQNSFTEKKKTIKITEYNLQNDNQHAISINSNNNQKIIQTEEIQIIDIMDDVVKSPQSEPKYFQFKSSEKTNSTAISESHQSADKLSYQIAEENYNKEQYISALQAIDSIQHKTKMVLRLGFQIEKKLNDGQNQYYSEKLLKNYLIYGCCVQDFKDIEEILQLQFKQYIYDEQISFQNDQWKPILIQLKSRKLSTERIQILDSIVMEIRYYKYDDIKKYFKSVIEKLKNFSKDKMDNVQDQFQLISKIYQTSQTH
ncbi:unnamed protein product [Paramecium octaurelia]|uniref:Uncharacterized protein n=1 Tax=Paramecium octaurelia TaxID=43137 RepID=A0A8S1W452_PAROT|nr:unnamed protein product [Paramecium octaurelia]